MWILEFIFEPMLLDILPHFVFSQSCLLTPPPCASFSWAWHPFPAGTPFLGGMVGQKVMLVCAVQLPTVTSRRCYWSRPLGILWPLSPCISLIARIFPHFQIFPLSTIITTFFLDTLLPVTTFSFGTPSFLSRTKPLFFPIQIVYMQKHNVWSVS